MQRYLPVQKNVLVVSCFHVPVSLLIIRTFVRHILYLDDLIQRILKIHLACIQHSAVPHEWEDGWMIVGRSPETELNEDRLVLLRRRHSTGIPLCFLLPALTK